MIFEDKCHPLPPYGDTLAMNAWKYVEIFYNRVGWLAGHHDICPIWPHMAP
jgi:hypothetical protein